MEVNFIKERELLEKMQSTFTINTSKREEAIDITKQVKDIVAKSECKEGICQVFVAHTTAGVVINENADLNLPLDILSHLKKNVPKGKWLHDDVDGNGDAHIKASLIGCSVGVPVKDGKMLLGTWQNIFFMEFDGPREGRKVIVTILENK